MFKEKCFICKKKDKIKNLRHYHYPFNGCHYHKDCLENAACNAKDYSTYTLALIVDIVNDINERKANRASLLIKCNKVCKQLKGTGKAPTGNPHITM